MCCFTTKVKSVSDTNIFARASKSPMQFLAYSMNFSAAQDLAMILPLPVPKGTPENGVRFINLEKYSDFFVAMKNGFPQAAVASANAPPNVSNPPKLVVIEIGAFEASFVPTVKDFQRLDERFRLPVDAWDKLPQYNDYGFAVFKLKEGNHKVHPMAFEFPRADREKLFFPTVHIHDGQVHPTAKFDHTLYAQFAMAPAGWFESTKPAGMFMTIEKCEGLVDGMAHIHRRKIRGPQKNEDTVA